MYFKCYRKEGKEGEEGTTLRLRCPQARVHGGRDLGLGTVHKSSEEAAETVYWLCAHPIVMCHRM